MLKRKHFAVFDTETIGINQKFIYDFGCVICDKTKVLHRYNSLVAEVYNDDALMSTAYYSDRKETVYRAKLLNGEIGIRPFSEVKRDFNDLLKHYNVETIAAYNIAFDIKAIKETLQYVNIPGTFLEQHVEVVDLYTTMCNSVLNYRSYATEALERGWVSEAGNLRTNAEVAYRFITGNTSFKESHTALEDSDIETLILQHVIKMKKKLYAGIADKPFSLVKFNSDNMAKRRKGNKSIVPPSGYTAMEALGRTDYYLWKRSQNL